MTEQSIAEKIERARRAPEDAERARDVAVPLRNLAAIYRDKGDVAGSCRVLRQAVTPGRSSSAAGAQRVRSPQRARRRADRAGEMSMTYETIDYSIRDRILTITLNRPTG